MYCNGEWKLTDRKMLKILDEVEANSEKKIIKREGYIVNTILLRKRWGQIKKFIFSILMSSNIDSITRALTIKNIRISRDWGK